MIGTCVYCMAENVEIHKDHLIPRVRGGSDEIENCVTACKKCNQEKSHLTPSEWKPDGLSSWIYTKEWELAAKYRMAKRDRIFPAIECMFCEVSHTLIIYSNIKEDTFGDSLMTSWWQYNGVIIRSGFLCRKETCQSKSKSIPGMLRDNHVEHMLGRHSLPAMARIFYDYETWLPPVRKKTIEMFWDLNLFPNPKPGGELEKVSVKYNWLTNPTHRYVP